MKIKVGELKTHFSKYIRELEQSDEPIEVCVREETVAYLVSAKDERRTPHKDARLMQRLEAVGIRVSQWGGPADSLASPGSCEQPANGPNNIESIRGESNY